MGTNFHTAWIDKPTPGYTTYNAASMNQALAALDKGITYLKNPMVGCEGVLSWDSGTGTLSWSAQLTIVFNRDDGDACHNHVATGNVVLTAGQFAYVELSETDNATVTVSAGTITTGSASNFIADNVLVLAYRSPSSGALHFIWLDQPFVAATGDVVGPVSSTDEAIARFDLATGKLLQNSLATLSDAGTINIPTGQTYDINGSPHTHAGSGDVSGPESSVADNLASFTDTSGKEIEDSGIALSDVSDAISSTHDPATAGTGLDINAQELSLEERNANLTFYPEYPGAVMTPSGSNNDPGTEGMTSDSEVVSNVRHNYYEWSSTIATGLQNYDVVVQIPIPFNFTGFQTGVSVALTLDIKTEENTITNNKLDVTINRDGQAATSALTDQKSSVAATWETIGFDETDAVLAAVVAGETLNVAIRLYSQSSKYARIGKINLSIKLT